MSPSRGRTPFLPQDGVYTSTGVVKVPDVTSGPQIGLVATLYPTAAQAADGTVSSVNPQAVNPVILLTAYKGDLGLDTGIPQNVYQLDETKLTQVLGDDGKPLVIDITPGQTVTLPDGLGTVTWDSLPRFVALDLRADPSLPWVLGTALAALLGIAVSLFAPRRRLWFVLTATARSRRCSRRSYTRGGRRSCSPARRGGRPRARVGPGSFRRAAGPPSQRAAGGIVNVTDLSVMALWTAATLYAIAMVAYSVRLARVAEAKLDAKNAALVPVAAVAVRRGCHRRETLQTTLDAADAVDAARATSAHLPLPAQGRRASAARRCSWALSCTSWAW